MTTIHGAEGAKRGCIYCKGTGTVKWYPIPEEEECEYIACDCLFEDEDEEDEEELRED